MTTEKDTWEQVGTIGVDAGLCWVGDPCYVLHQDGMPSTLGKDWVDFCNKLHEGDDPNVTPFNYELGHPGLGIAVQTGFGDGEYPVYVYRRHGRVAEVRVVFIEPDEEDIFAPKDGNE